MRIEDWNLPSTTELIARRLERFTNENPWVGLGLVTSAFLFVLVAVFLFLVQPQGPAVTRSDTLARQMEELARAREELGNLQKFVDAQTTSIRQEQTALTDSKRLPAQPGPDVDLRSDSPQRDAALGKSDKWRDFAAGAGTGFLTSFLASLFFELVRGLGKQRRGRGSRRA